MAAKKTPSTPVATRAEKLINRDINPPPPNPLCGIETRDVQQTHGESVWRWQFNGDITV